MCGLKHFLVNLLAFILIALYVAIHLYFLFNVKEDQVNLLMLLTIVEGLIIKPITDLVDNFLEWLEFEA